MRLLRRWYRRAFNRYPSMTCRCGYRVLFLGNRDEQAARAFSHWEANHEGQSSIITGLQDYTKEDDA